MTTKDTIYALSTPWGFSATATIRISGPRAIKAAARLTNSPPDNFRHSLIKPCSIYNKNNILLDRAMVVCYHGPRSYTGENMAEIHTHGNPNVVERLFAALSSLGLRLANPGEFTRIAYLNNKIDLIQAESVLNLLTSETEGGINLSLNNLGGALSKRFLSIQKELISSLSLIEYELDISETNSLKKTKHTTLKSIKNSLKKIDSLINSYRSSKKLKNGFRLAIVGKPNVGKSTLFNVLSSYEKAIVTNIPGTTRDLVETPLYIAGFSVTLIDTAGIRSTKNTIEKIGVNKTLDEIKNADIILYIIDPANKNEKIVYEKNKPVFLVYNKIDLLTEKDQRKAQLNKNIDVFISAKRKIGINKLNNLIKKTIRSNEVPPGGLYITSKRQEEVLTSIKKTLSPLLGSTSFDLEIFALEIKTAINSFDWLLGKTTPDDVLNEVFSSFCVGK